jgi:hypothetical protein
MVASSHAGAATISDVRAGMRMRASPRPHTEKLTPQPQDERAFGFLILKA